MITTTHQLIEDLDLGTLREICERQGYRFSEQTSVQCLRATVLDDYERGDLGGKDIRAVVDDREDRLEAANRIIADYVLVIAGQAARIRELEAR